MARIIARGVPFDANSSYMRGAADAPKALRAEIEAGYGNMCAETGADLSDPALFRFDSDVILDNRPGDSDYTRIQEAAAAIYDRGAKPFMIGGDHSISLPLLRAAHARHSKLTIVHFDAHPDLYDRYDDSPWSHACPFARIMEEGLAARLIQIGVRTLNSHQRDQGVRFGVEMFPMSATPTALPVSPGEAVYVSFDMDALDPGIAPGVSHHEPGGLSVREAIALIHTLPRGGIAGADLVELNPSRDPSRVSAAAALKLLKEIGGVMADAGATDRKLFSIACNGNPAISD